MHKSATEIINAGDPDREGQLLVDEVLEYLKNKKPVKRIILNALDEKTIRKALDNLRNNADFQNLKESALARQRADWLVGMNLSRAYTIVANQAGYDGTFPVGRVKTPTLALVVRREQEINKFVPTDHYSLKAIFNKGENFTTTWKPKEDQPGKDSEGRLIDKSEILKIQQQINTCTTNPIITECETVEKKESQRLPFSLSSLQVLAGKYYGYDPQTVLDTAQRLYEKKITTYPRSDCDYLPQNQFQDAKNILENLKASGNIDLAKWANGADTKIESRAWNDKKITAHHAIIPTETKCEVNKLPEVERNLYFLIAQAYIAQFYPIHIYNQTNIKVTHADEEFSVTGRVLKIIGWKELYTHDKSDDDGKDNDEATALPPVKKDDIVDFIQTDIISKTTKAPERFTSSTLLLAMKDIHKYVQNEELRKQLKDVSGLGTEATRATIIKELMTRKFLIEQKKKLYPTDQANLLISILPKEMTYPDTTAIWETLLNRMVQGNVDFNNFMTKQKAFITNLCKSAITIKIPDNPNQTGTKCPKCNKGILKIRTGKKGVFWGCSHYPDCNGIYNDKKGQPDLNPVPRKWK